MKEAGIDTSTFMAHSSQGAATSKAKAVGVPMVDILKAANWSSNSTFCRFYNRPTNDWFRQSILSRVSFKRYHAVSWLCCRNESRISRVQLQIPQGSQIQYGEDELYEMKDTCRQHSQLPFQPNSQCIIMLLVSNRLHKESRVGWTVNYHSFTDLVIFKQNTYICMYVYLCVFKDSNNETIHMILDLFLPV